MKLAPGGGGRENIKRGQRRQTRKRQTILMNVKRSLVSGTKTSTIRKGGANEEGIRFCPIIHDINAKKPAQMELHQIPMRRTSWWPRRLASTSAVSPGPGVLGRREQTPKTSAERILEDPK